MNKRTDNGMTTRAFCVVALGLLTANLNALADGQTLEMPVKLDLKTAVNLAHQCNPAINEAREKINEQEGLLLSTESAAFPSIGAYGQYQWDESERIGSFGGGPDPDQEQWRAGVQLTQPVYSGGLLRSTIASRRFQTDAFKEEVRAAESKVMAQVHLNFYQALLAREVLSVRKESLSLLENQLVLTSNRFSAGAGARFDVLQAQVRVANARPPLIQAENNYRLAIDQLRNSLGAVYADGAGPDDILLEGTLLPEGRDSSLDSAIAEAIQNRPELRAIAKRRESAEAELRKAKAQRSPRIDFYSSYGLENDRFNPDADPLQGIEAGVQAKLSLWESGRIRGEIAQARSRLQQIAFRESSARLTAELEVRNAWNRAHEAREIISAAELGITQAEEALRLAQNRYSVGALTQLDVLTSQLEYTQSKLNRISAVHDYNAAHIELLLAIGQTPGAGLLTPNEPR